MDVIKRLNTAIESGEVLTIIYYGGSNPGKPREISPIKIQGDKVSARSLATNEVKSFSISKIAIQEKGEIYGANPSTVGQKSFTTFDNLQIFFQMYKDKFETLGWYVKTESDLSISLYSFFKNGNIKKYPDLKILFEEFSNEIEYDIDKDDFVITNKVKKQKPWSVIAKGKHTKTFMKLNNAIETFITFAENMSPTNKNEDI